MADRDPVQATWSAALAAANETLRGIGGKTPPAQRGTYRERARVAAKAVFDKANAGVKSVRVDIAWGDKPNIELEVVTLDGRRYPVEQLPVVEQPKSPEPATLSAPPVRAVLLPPTVEPTVE